MEHHRADSKKQQIKLNVDGLVKGSSKGKFTATAADGTKQELTADGFIMVDKNEALTLTFEPNDFTNPYYADLTGEKGGSFSILTGLTDGASQPIQKNGAKHLN